MSCLAVRCLVYPYDVLVIHAKRESLSIVATGPLPGCQCCERRGGGREQHTELVDWAQPRPAHAVWFFAALRGMTPATQAEVD